MKVEDFQAFGAIMALGNRSAAAKFLKIRNRTFYELIDKWKSKGPDYKRMFNMVQWRKKIRRKMQVPLGDYLQSGEPGDKAENPETIDALLTKLSERSVGNEDSPGLLGEILEALEKQTAGNWPSVRDELIAVVREELAQ